MRFSYFNDILFVLLMFFLCRQSLDLVLSQIFSCMLLISVQLLFYEYMHGANAVMSVSSGHLNVFAVSLIFYILCS